MYVFDQRLKELRKKKNITQKELAAAIGITERGLQGYEIKDRKPGYDALIALADYFDVSLDFLCGRSDDPSRR